jgi:hypothetical protein
MKSKDKEAEAVNELQRENGAQQTRPMRAEVARRRLDAAAWAKPGPQRGGTERSEGSQRRRSCPKGEDPVRRGRRQLQKRWAWLVRGSGAGRWVAKRGGPAPVTLTGRVGRLWLAPGGGSMRHDSGGAKVVGRWRDSCIRWAAPDGHAA